MEFKLCVLALFIVGAVSALTMPMEDPAWREFKLQFGKFYKTKSEELARYAIWRQHVKAIGEHNSNSKKSFHKGLNQFSDLVCCYRSLKLHTHFGQF